MKIIQMDRRGTLQFCATNLSKAERRGHSGRPMAAGLLAIVALLVMCAMPLPTRGGVLGSPVGWGYYDDDFFYFAPATNTVPTNLTGLVAVAGGWAFTLGLETNGAVVAWGEDPFGETNVPASATNVVGIAAGWYFGLALNANGTVTGWGTESEGATNVPASVTNAVQIAAGGFFGMALNANGGVTAWGENGSGQTNVPPNVTNAVAIAAGYVDGLALLSNGTVVVWGDDTQNQTNVPASVTNAVAISAGDDDCMALLSDGTVVAWGYNGENETDVPAGATNVVAIASGFYHNLALLADGTVLAWGADFDDQCNVPASLSNVVAVTAGFGYSVALVGTNIVSNPAPATPPTISCPNASRVNCTDTNGTAVNVSVTVADQSSASLTVIWSVNDAGYQTNSLTSAGGGFSTNLTLAADFGGPGPFTISVSVSDGYNAAASCVTAVAIDSGDDIASWGTPENGQGNPPDGLTNVVALAAGFYHTIALKTDGTVIGWGDDELGQTDVPAGATNTVQIAAGGSFGLALQANGTIIGWGDDSWGEINVPASATNAVVVAAGTIHSLAVLANGTVIAWGDNSSGEINVPAGLSNVVAVAGGDGFSLAVKADGTVVGWGDDSTTEIDVPAGLSNVVAITAGLDHSVALKADGTVVAWGDNAFAQTDLPGGLTNVVAISAGDLFTLALNADGTVVGWGDDTYGEIDVPAGLADASAIASGQSLGFAVHELQISLAGPGSTNIECHSAFTDPGATGSGSCGVDLTSSITASNLVTTAVGNYQVTYTVTEGPKQRSVTRTVNVVDTTPPVPDAGSLPDATGQCSVTLTPPTATDACAGPITGTTGSPTNYNAQGTYYVAWTYNDGNGNSTVQTQRVIVADTIPPVPDTDQLPDVTGQCSATVSATPTATDNCAGAVTGATTDPTNYVTQGTFYVRWTYSDGNGNTTVQTQRVVVADTVAPVPNVSALPDVVAQCSASLTAPTAEDNCAGAVTGTTTDPTNYVTQGTFYVHWTYGDGHGNSTVQTQRVIIAETGAPVITCPATITVNATNTTGTVVGFATPPASNACSDASVVCAPPSGSTFAVGTNTVDCTAFDQHDHTNQCSFAIVVRGALDQTQFALDGLITLSAGVTNHANLVLLDAALKQLTNSASALLWTDDNDPKTAQALKVWQDDQSAARKLVALLHSKHTSVNTTNVEAIITELVSATRLQAEVAIADAQTAHEKASLITAARALITKGDAAARAGSPVIAIGDYKAAWNKVRPRG